MEIEVPDVRKDGEDTSVTGEKMLNTFCPGRGSNQDLLRGSQTLYCVAIKAGLYSRQYKCVLYLTLPHIPPPL